MNYSILPLLEEKLSNSFSCYNKWKISPESLEDFTENQIVCPIFLFFILSKYFFIPQEGIGVTHYFLCFYPARWQADK